MERGFTSRESVLCFLRAMHTVLDEMTTYDHQRMTFVEFLEGIGHVSEIKSSPQMMLSRPGTPTHPGGNEVHQLAAESEARALAGGSQDSVASDSAMSVLSEANSLVQPVVSKVDNSKVSSGGGKLAAASSRPDTQVPIAQVLPGVLDKVLYAINKGSRAEALKLQEAAASNVGGSSAAPGGGAGGGGSGTNSGR